MPTEENLLLICLSAFVVVLTVLSLLALMMRGLIWLFPFTAPAAAPAGGAARPQQDDAAVVAAIHTAAATKLGGAKVIRIEETTR